MPIQLQSKNILTEQNCANLIYCDFFYTITVNLQGIANTGWILKECQYKTDQPDLLLTNKINL